MDRVLFTEEMRKDYTILLPNMLPVHFKILEKVFKYYGYNTVLLENTGEKVISAGLKYVHNDACYPVQLVVGQFLDALASGKYDLYKVALMITQTGGGCRASNYIAVLRKALKDAGLAHIPVISLNFSGLEKNPGFKMTVPMAHRAAYACLYGDLIMSLKNQCLPYEAEKGATEKTVAKWTDILCGELTKKRLNGKVLKKMYGQIARDFEQIEKVEKKIPKVGIVGEIFVKFSPLGNNDIEKFLLSENSEPVMPGLINFILYCMYNYVEDHRLYGKGAKAAFISKYAIKLINKVTENIAKEVRENSSFVPPSPLYDIHHLTDKYIGTGVKMGEGWLLVAEISELLESGVKNIVCVQPFGCLPNHIVAKGVMKRMMENNPGANIVAIDYDPGMTKVNQENRLRLMLSCAEENLI